MKIIMIIDAWEPIVWWWQVHVKNICEKLIKNHNCDIDLFVRSLKWEDWTIYNKDEILLDWKLKIFRCGRPKKFFNLFERILSIFSIFFKIVKESKKNNYDLIHAHSFLWLFSWKISSIFLRIPVIATIHWANLMDKWEKSVYYYVEKFLCTKIKYDLVIAPNKNFLDYNNTNKNIKVIWNWINIKEFEEVKNNKNSNIFKILFVWRLEWTKWIDILIKSINKIDRSILDEKNLEVHLIWYWYNEKEYKELVKKYDLSKYIFFRWKISWKKLIEEYKSSDLFILPSRSEWFWIVILEAMISKTLVLSTKSWWPEDIIQNWINWLLIDKQNIDDLTKKIKNILLNWVDNKQLMLDNAYNTVVNNYTWDIIWEKIFTEYKKIREWL